MIISPNTIVKSRIIEFNKLPMYISQVQQNGVDVRINTSCSFSGNYVFREHVGTDGKENTFKVSEVQPDKHDFFHFKRGHAYGLECFEIIKIPDGMCAILYGRSSLNRNGILVRGSLYDAGFNGVIGCTLYAGVDCSIRKKTRIAQIIFFEADSSGTYDGQYQTSG